MLVRSVEYREPEYDDEQVRLLLAFARFERGLGRHGHPMAEAMSPDADPNNYDGGYRYVVDPPERDWAQKEYDDAVAAYKRDAGENANLHGLIWRVRRVDDPPIS